MGSLSQRIACMSCRLYFKTGVWPVWRAWDFAQPRPRRRLRLPCLSARSFAPGSSVTYRPGMPIAPAARVISIRLLSTTAGASTTLPFAPCAFASKPTQSIAQSTSATPRTSATISPSRSCLVRSIGSKPTFLAWASRSWFMSPISTAAAPRMRADAAAARPTGPAPAT